jgi:RHH-type transcriptional regulator, rel operon repressor / antitoxin RelB
MLAVRLDPDLDSRLTAVAKRTGRSKSYYAREALREKIEEMEDIALLEEALRDPDVGQRISHAQMRRELGLDD